MPIVYVPQGGEPAAITALAERLDDQADLSAGPVEQRVMSFTYLKADRPEQGGPGDIVEYQDAAWYVGEPARSVEDGAAWTVRAERAGD